jgi:GNAT superfamily N-acetyltransferase
MDSDAPGRIRRATAGDGLSCARLVLMASHGMAEAVFRDLVPGQPTEQIITERRIRPEGKTTSFTNWWVAEDHHRVVAGGINAYPLDGRTGPTRDELLTPERIRVLAPMIELDAEAAGTYFINILAVFPEHRHAGIARRLIALAVEEARKAEMAAVSLTTFEDDARLVAYYLGVGFTVAASRPIVPHECLLCAGNLVLMTMPVTNPN